MKCHKICEKTTKLMLLNKRINTDGVNKADREREQTAAADSVCAACLDSKLDPSRHCCLALRGCKTGNNL